MQTIFCDTGAAVLQTISLLQFVLCWVLPSRGSRHRDHRACDGRRGSLLPIGSLFPAASSPLKFPTVEAALCPQSAWSQFPESSHTGKRQWRVPSSPKSESPLHGAVLQVFGFPCPPTCPLSPNSNSQSCPYSFLPNVASSPVLFAFDPTATDAETAPRP